MSDARRFGGSSSDTIQRVIASCPKLAQNAYKHQHRDVKFTNRNWRNNHLLGEPHSPYYECEPWVVVENDSYIFYKNHTFLTDNNVPLNQTDMTMADKTNKEAAFIDI